MNITTLQGIISGCIDGGVFTLTAETATEKLSASIATLIGLIPEQNQTQELVITGATQPSSASQAIVNGQAVLFDGCPAYSVSAVFYLDGTGTPQLTLQTTSLPTGWTFSQTFPPLKNSIFDVFPVTQPGFICASAPGAAAAPFATGINFQSGLTATGPLAQASWIVPNLTDLTFSGTITLPATSGQAPTITLTTPAGNGINLGAFVVNTQVELKSSYIGTGANQVLSAMGQLLFTIPVQSGPPPVNVQLAMGLSAGPTNLLTFGASSLAVPLNNWSDLQVLSPSTNFGSMVPTQMPQAASLLITDLMLVISPKQKQVASLAVTVELVNLAWTIIPGAPGNPPVLVLNDAGISFTVPFLTSSSPSASIFGIFMLAGGELQLEVTAPELLVTAQLVAGQISVSELIKQMVQALTGSVPSLPGLNIYELDMSADITTNTYSLSAGIADVWSMTLPSTGFSLGIESLDIALDYSNNGLDVTFGGTVNIDGLDLVVQVTESSEGWSFMIGTAPGESLNLISVIQKFMSAAFGGTGFWPSFLPQSMAVTNVAFGIESSTDGETTQSTSYSFQAETAGPWQFTLGSETVSIDAAVQITWNGGKGASGTISGDLSVGNLALTASYSFMPESETITASIAYQGATLTGTITSGKSQDTIVTIAFGNLSFGEIVDWLVDLVDPSLNFKLPAPWSVLYDINFDGLTLTVNMTKKSVGISYALNKNLGIIDIGTISLTYITLGGQGTVNIGFTGSFAGQTFGPDSPLQWDMLNESPPTPSTGTQMFDLQYLGLGQHVMLIDPSATTMPDVLAGLEKTVQATQGSSTPPWQNLQFAPSSNLLFGTLFSVMGTVTLGAVFNDPQLYGMNISLAGQKAGSFAGLYFEILYRKINDSVGVYHIDLKLPTAMRTLEFGEVSITLPEVIVDIYTNGDFYLDFGFPYNNDWSNSFGLQIFPFVGAGGFYFGKLSAATATNVPQITNGTFDPVIEFGLALSIGAGKDFSAGPLSGGVTLQVQGTLVGVIGWFNPSDSSVPSDRYYWIQGSIAIVGNLYAQIDFVIIKVNISVTAYASVTLTVAAYQPILIAMSVGVSVTASVKVIFFTIHFSFSTHLDASFTLGSASATPWQLASSSGGGGGATQNLSMVRRRRVHRRRPARKLLAAPAPNQAQVLLTFTPVAVLSGTPVSVPVSLVPTFTVAGATNPQVQVVMTPYILNTVPGTAQSFAETRLLAVAAGSDPQTAPFNLIIQGLLLWSVQALLGRTAGTISLHDLNNLYYALSKEDVSQAGFTPANLDLFMGFNYVLLVSGLPDLDPSPVGGTIFPMPSTLQMLPQGESVVDFETFTATDSTYQAKLAAYFGQLGGNTSYAQPQDPLQPQPATDGLRYSDSTTSMAKVIFTDYSLMVMTSAVQGAIDLLQAFPYTTQSGDSLASIAAAFSGNATYQVQPDDTLNSIAQAFEVPAQEIIAANSAVNFNQPFQLPLSLVMPPATVNATYYTLSGDTLTSIATGFVVPATTIQVANPNVDFSNLQPGTALTIPVSSMLFGNAGATASQTVNVSITLAGLTYQVGSGATLQSVVTTFNLTNAEALATLNASDSSILLTGTSLTIAGSSGTIPYVVQSGDSYNLVAAYFYVRNLETLSDATLSWFTQSIVSLNQSVNFNQTLTAGTALTVPTNQQGGTTTYATKVGDTLNLVAGYFTAINGQDSGLSSLAAALQTQYPSGLTAGQTIQVSAQTHVIQGQDTLAGLAALFGVSVANLADTNVNAAILAAQAMLALPPVQVAAGQTLSAIAASYSISLDALTGRIAPVTNLFAAGTNLTLPPLVSADIGNMITSLMSEEPSVANNIAGMVSRFMLYGAQLPNPADMTFQSLSVQQIEAGEANGKVALAPLYQLTGQQFTAPDPTTATFTITFTNVGGDTWVQFASAYTSQKGDTLASIAQAYSVSQPALESANPGVNWNSLQAGTLITIQNVPAANPLVITLTSTFMQANFPATYLNPEIQSGPARLPLLQQMPVQYSLATKLSWQAGTLPPFAPGANGGAPPQSGQPSIWQFPTSLLDQMAGANSLHPYALMTGSTSDPMQAPLPVGFYDWATVLPVTVRQVPAGSGSGGSPNSVQVVGADQNGSQLLSQLWTYLTAPGSSDSAQLYLLYSPSSTSSNSSGLVSDTLDMSNTVLLQTNLSTYTLGGFQGVELFAAVEAPPPSGTYYAALGAGTPFIQLLWEASVTGTGGFYLNYVTQSGNGLPSNLFASDSEATIYLVVILASESASSSPNRTLYPFHNCAAVLDNIDPSHVNLFAEATDQSNMTEVATVPPGNIGFALTRANASLETPSSAQVTAALFNLLGYALPPASNPFFSEVAEGFPSGPIQQPEGGDESTWTYQQVIPIYPLASNPLTQAAPGLPPAAQNPYAGLATGSQATLSFAFYDIFGNTMPTTPAIPNVTIPVAYYDSLIGLATWPGAASAYSFGPSAQQLPQLTISLDLDVSRYVAGGGLTYANAAYNAATNLLKYAQIYYQVQQPDIQVSIGTSFDSPSSPPAPDAALKLTLQNFASAAYLFLSAAQSLLPTTVTVTQSTLGQFNAATDTSAADVLNANAGEDGFLIFSSPLTIPRLYTSQNGDTLGSVATTTGVSAGQLVQLNEQVPLTTGATLTTAARFYTTQTGDTLQSISNLLSTTPMDLAVANSGTAGLLNTGTVVTYGQASVTIANGDTFDTLVAAFSQQSVTVTVAQLATANATVQKLFVVDVAVAIADTPVAQGDTSGSRSYTTAVGDTLASIAAAQRCTVVGLATANSQLQGLLTAGTPITFQGVTLTVGSTDTFSTLVAQLLAQNVTASVADLAVANQGFTGLVATGQKITLVDYVTQPGDTFSSLVAAYTAFSLTGLVNMNLEAPTNLYPVGTSLLRSTASYQVLPGDTLSNIAAQSGGLTVAQLAPYNSSTGLRADATLLLPNAVQIPTTVTLYAPYLAPSSVSLTTIAQNLNQDLGNLGTLNATMPNLINPGQTISATGYPQITTQTTDTLFSLAAQWGVDASAFVTNATVSGMTTLIQTGALFVADLPTVSSNTTLQQLATNLGVQLDDLALANGATTGLLQAGATVTAFTSSSATIKVGQSDTLQSLVARFSSKQNVQTSVTLIAEANAALAGLLQSGALFLVPPQAVQIVRPVTNPVIPAPIFPLSVTVNMARDASLIDPEFQGVAAVASSQSVLGATLPSGSSGPLSLTGLATSFEAAFQSYSLKLATGPNPDDSSAVPLWVVNLGSGGFSQVAVQGSSPLYFGISPLSTQLISLSSVPIQPLEQDGTLGTAQSLAFQSIDPERWVRELLSAVDLFLSPQYSVPAYQISPTAFTSVVTAKGQIAEAILPQVAQILVSEQPSAGALAAAQEALSQSLLVSLSQGYATDALVQFQVEVASPFSAAYTTGYTDGFAQPAAFYNVSQQGFALAAATLPGALNAGQTVSYQSQTYTIQANDTLFSIAQHYNVSVQALPGNLTVTSSGGLFAPNVTLAMNAMAKAVQSTDSFASLAAYFSTTVGNVAIANESVANIIPAGTVITIGTINYTVQTGDTLITIATAFSLTPDAFAEEPNISTTAGLLASPQTLYAFSSIDQAVPRFVGRGVSQVYQVPAGLTIQGLNTVFPVSLPYLVNLIDNMNGILNTGLAFTFNAQSASIKPGDTLGSIATALNTDPVTLVQQMVLPAGQGLFATNAGISLLLLSRQPESTDSFETLSDLFGVSVPQVADSNATLAGIINAGSVIKLSTGSSYTVQSTDTLTTIATALSVTVDELASDPDVVLQTGLFNTATTLYMALYVPPVAFSTAKTSLADGNSLVTFLFSTSADASYRNLLLSMNYPLNALEYNVASVPGIAGYQSSNWLTFIDPLATSGGNYNVNTNIGLTDIPIPLRFYPPLPTLTEQTWEATNPQANTIAGAKQWSFDFSWEHQDAAQDSATITVLFNQMPALTAFFATNPALYEALAQFDSVWAPLQPLLAGLLEMSGPPPTSGALVNAVQSFATVVTQVAQAWSAGAGFFADALPGGEAAITYTYQVETTYDYMPTATYRSQLILAADTTGGPWPEVYVPGDQNPLASQPIGASTMVYTYPPETPAFTPLVHRFVFPGNDAVAVQNGQSKISITRNEILIDGAATNPAFIYQTPVVSYPNQTAPFVQNNDAITINSGADLTSSLTQMFEAILNTSDPLTESFQLQIGFKYGHVLVNPPEGSGLQPIISYMAGFLAPQIALSSSYGIGNLIADIETQITSWVNLYQPLNAAPDAYAFSVTVFASNWSTQPPPLLQLGSLIYNLPKSS